MTKKQWFEISHEGWARRAATRSLGRLLLEAVQNAFDAAAPEISVRLGHDTVTIEDDANQGFADGRLVYTVFLSDKADDPDKRGRLGRGLKELIAAMSSAEVETVGTTILFNEDGRIEQSNDRTSGTRLSLHRKFGEEELEEARAQLRLCIPPKGSTLRVDGRAVRRPKCVLTLGSCELETVEMVDSVERAVTGVSAVSIYTPRRGQQPQLYEMGIPIETWDVPWHVDIAQRVPLQDGRDGAPERYKLRLKALLLESMIHRYLETKELRADWVYDVISRFPVKTSILDAYVSRAFPKGAVLGGTSRANDRARQLGAHVIDASAISNGAYVALGRVVETADDYVRRRSAEFGGEDVEPDETQQRFAEAVRWLARRLAGRVVRVRFFARDPSDAGLLEDATCDAETRVISFNTRGLLRFDDILDPTTLGVVLHEIAHLETPEHGQRFIDRLQWLGGQAARVLAEGGRELADGLRRGDPDRRKADAS